jgi:hypothetical protein
MTPRTTRTLAAILMVLILGCGFALGVTVDRLWLAPAGVARSAESPEARTARHVERFRQALGLDAAQVRVVEEVLRRNFTEAEAIRRRVEPELAAVRARGRAEIKQVLRPEQRRRYEERIARRTARRAAAPR